MNLARRPASTLLLQLLVALLCWSDAFELHAGSGGHDALMEGGTVAPAALHPEEPGHLEPSPTLPESRCPACALQLQGLGCRPPAGRPIGRVLSTSVMSPRALPRPVSPSRPVRGGRAPPLV